MADPRDEGEAHADRDLREPNDAEQGTAAGGEPTAERPAPYARRGEATVHVVSIECTRCGGECFDHVSRDGERVCIGCVSDELDEERADLKALRAVSSVPQLTHAEDKRTLLELYEDVLARHGFDFDAGDEYVVDWLDRQLKVAAEHRDAVRSLSTPTTPPAQQHGRGERSDGDQVSQAAQPSSGLTVVYIAHQLSGTPEAMARNRANAARWVGWAALHMAVSPVADWITLSGQLSEQHRALGLRCDLALVERCEEVWLVGGRVSDGMRLELEHAREHGIVVRDLTALGYEPPDGPIELPEATRG